MLKLTATKPTHQGPNSAPQFSWLQYTLANPVKEIHEKDYVLTQEKNTNKRPSRSLLGTLMDESI
jgi:hypothetical protein